MSTSIDLEDFIITKDTTTEQLKHLASFIDTVRSNIGMLEIFEDEAKLKIQEREDEAVKRSQMSIFNLKDVLNGDADLDEGILSYRTKVVSEFGLVIDIDTNNILDRLDKLLKSSLQNTISSGVISNFFIENPHLFLFSNRRKNYPLNIFTNGHEELSRLIISEIGIPGLENYFKVKTLLSLSRPVKDVYAFFRKPSIQNQHLLNKNIKKSSILAYGATITPINKSKTPSFKMATMVSEECLRGMQNKLSLKIPNKTGGKYASKRIFEAEYEKIKLINY